MTACADRIAAVLLAAGGGSRFGGNKLEADFRGAMLGSWAARTLAMMGFGWTFAVHDPAHAGLAYGYEALGLTLVPNLDPGRGLSSSLTLAVHAAESTGADALMILLADMPLVKAQHLRALIDAHAANPGAIIASESAGIPTPPAIFPRTSWPQLRAGQGDAGARALLRDAIRVPADPATLIDIDTVADLERLR
jgi:molybdenum cofactor cytidylyltransferase